MHNLTIVGVSGKVASGKSTLARAICEADPRFRRVSLADGLKDDIARLCFVDREIIEANKDRFRVGLQWYGTDIMRWKHGEDYWIQRLLRDVRDRQYNFVVVDDVRFPNELEGLRAAGSSLMVRLALSRAQQAQRCIAQFGQELSPEKLSHRSETALDGYQDFDLTFDQGDRPLLPLQMAQTILWHLGDAQGSRHTYEPAQ